MKLQKATDDEKRARTERIQAALLVASRVPLEVAKTSRRLLDLCERTVERAATATVSDIGVGAFLAETALRGAALNVMINLASVKDAAQVKALSEDLDRAVDGSDAQRKRITDIVESRIARERPGPAPPPRGPEGSPPDRASPGAGHRLGCS